MVRNGKVLKSDDVTDNMSGRTIRDKLRTQKRLVKATINLQFYQWLYKLNIGNYKVEQTATQLTDEYDYKVVTGLGVKT